MHLNFFKDRSDSQRPVVLFAQSRMARVSIQNHQPHLRVTIRERTDLQM
jgi:hypothetical protein